MALPPRAVLRAVLRAPQPALRLSWSRASLPAPRATSIAPCSPRAQLLTRITQYHASRTTMHAPCTTTESSHQYVGDVTRGGVALRSPGCEVDAHQTHGGEPEAGPLTAAAVDVQAGLEAPAGGARGKHG